MKLNLHIGSAFLRHAAFTLPEILISMAIFVMIATLVVSSQLYGFKMFHMVRPRLSASDEARTLTGRLIDEVRTAHLVRVGNGTATTFTEPPYGAWQQGNALQIYPGTNTNTFVRYFWNSSDQSLKRITEDPLDLVTIAHAVSNSVVFTAEDFQGKVLTNNFNNRVIGVKLQFFELHYPRRAVGPGNLYEFYQISTKVTRRKISL
jgi:prepilin-type N-terminal cleavage/methylation domain-containing protein